MPSINDTLKSIIDRIAAMNGEEPVYMASVNDNLELIHAKLGQVNDTIGGISSDLQGITAALGQHDSSIIALQAHANALNNPHQTTAAQVDAPNTDGSGATGTWPIAITGNAATVAGLGVAGGWAAPGANKVVRSNSSGYTFFNYIHSDTGNNENPAISQVITTTGSEGFFRKASLAHLKASLETNPSFSVARSYSQGSIAHNTITKVSWTNKNIDPYSVFDLANSRLYPSAGTWLFNVSVVWDAMTPPSGAYLQILLYKNGGMSLSPPLLFPPAINSYHGQQVSFLVPGASGYYEIYVRQTTNATRTIYADASMISTLWSGIRLGA